jgi:predicted GNAT family acetyltransferase
MTHHPQHQEGMFFILTPHGRAELRYDKEGSVMRMYHTFTPEEERGKGVASSLALAAFTFAKEHEMKVQPDCEYLDHFLQKHPEWRELCV